MVSSGRGAASNDLDAGVGCVVGALALFAVVVSDVVSVFLVKLSSKLYDNSRHTGRVRGDMRQYIGWD